MTTEGQLQLDVPQLVLEAHERCQDYLSPTPLKYSPYLSARIEGDVWLKLDSPTPLSSSSSVQETRAMARPTQTKPPEGCRSDP